MTFLHVSDLHIGKRLCGRSLIEDQRRALEEIEAMFAAPDVDALLVAGDVFDKSQPSGEAVELASRFLSALARVGKPAFIVSGNHDSPEQIAYCREILAGANLHMSAPPAQAAVSCRLRDEYGEVHIHLLPFLRPMDVRRAHPSRAGEVQSYADALRVALEELHIDPGARNVLVAHQFVAGGDGVFSDSEERMVGGVDAVPAALFQPFDYVALGHLHAPQRAGGERIRYAGSPLKYSLSEANQRKAALKLRLEKKGAPLQIEALPYHPLHELRQLRGTLEELTREGPPEMDYIFATLTDEVLPLDPAGALLARYPNLMQIFRENSRSGQPEAAPVAGCVEELSPLEHFERFFREQNNQQSPTPNQLALMREIIREAEEDAHAAH